MFNVYPKGRNILPKTPKTNKFIKETELYQIIKLRFECEII